MADDLEQFNPEPEPSPPVMGDELPNVTRLAELIRRAPSDIIAGSMIRHVLDITITTSAHVPQDAVALSMYPKIMEQSAVETLRQFGGGK